MKESQMHEKSPDAPKKPADVAIQKIGPEDEASLAIYESVFAEVTQAYEHAPHDHDASVDDWLIASGMEDFIDKKMHEQFGDAAPELIQAMHAEVEKYARDHRH
jgi:hypothetical protein